MDGMCKCNFLMYATNLNLPDKLMFNIVQGLLLQKCRYVDKLNNEVIFSLYKKQS